MAIGYTKCNLYREQVCLKLQAAGYPLVNYISPGSNCWNGTIRGNNIIVFDNVFVGVGCELYDGVIISEGTTLSHDVKVGKYVFFSDEVTVGGHATIGNNSFLGLNSTIKSNSKIGSYNIVGSGTNVIRSTEDYSLTIGNPGVSYIKNTLQVDI